MAKRKTRKKTTRWGKTRRKTAKTGKKTAKKRAAPRKKATKKRAGRKIKAGSHWDAYKHLQKRVDIAWKKLKKDVKNKAGSKTLLHDRNQLLLLLGECNYMARECMRCAKKFG